MTDTTDARSDGFVEVVAEGTNQWSPTAGAETLALLQQFTDLDPASRQRVCDEAASVLRSCVPPGAEDESDTGLVVGHVQSGKTMSFTTVAALARDSRFPVVI